MDTTTSMDYSGTSDNGSNGSESHWKEQAKTQAQQVVEQTREKATELVGQARSQITTRLEEQKSTATGGLETVAHAIRQTGQQLQDQNQQMVGQYAETVAQQVERVSDFLREKDVDELIEQVEGFARREPLVFLIGTFAVGFLAARLLKNAAPAGDSGYQASYDSTTYDYTAGADVAETGGMGYANAGADYSDVLDTTSDFTGASALTSAMPADTAGSDLDTLDTDLSAGSDLSGLGTDLSTGLDTDLPTGEDVTGDFLGGADDLGTGGSADLPAGGGAELPGGSSFDATADAGADDNTVDTPMLISSAGDADETKEEKVNS